jgi:hypothetical protein
VFTGLDALVQERGGPVDELVVGGVEEGVVHIAGALG